MTRLIGFRGIGRAGTGGGVSLGVGAALGIATLVYGLVPSGEPSGETTVSVVPVISTGFTGIVAGGRF